jgi:hypothetical protein
MRSADMSARTTNAATQAKRPSVRGIGSFAIFTTASAGVLLAHWLTYVIVFASPSRRAAILAETGHSYFPVAATAVLALALAGGGCALASAFDARRRGSTAAPSSSFASLGLRLAAIECAAFAGMEMSERAASGVPVFGPSLVHIAAIAPVVLLAAALAGAAILRLLGRAGHALAGLHSAVQAPRAQRGAWTLVDGAGATPAAMAGGPGGSRAPPTA